MARRPLDPRISNISCDANALDRKGGPGDALVDRFDRLRDSGHLTVVIAGGVRREVQHPNTPTDVKGAMLTQIFNMEPGLNSLQVAQRSRVEAVLQGNALPGAHAADASHLSEAAETGCAYFITNDKRILKRRAQLQDVLPPSLTVVTLVEFLEIFDDYETRSPAPS